MFCNNNQLQINMLECCLESIRHFESDIPIVLFHDSVDSKKLMQIINKYSIKTFSLEPRNPYVNKYLTLIKSPFDHTLYIDNDVICTRPFGDLFEVDKTLAMKKNEDYDIAILGEAISENIKSSYQQFPWYNTGILKYNDKLKKYLKDYISCLEHIPNIQHFDQSIISFVLFHEEIKTASSRNGIELQLVLCDTYIKPQYPQLGSLLIQKGIDIDMNYTNNYDFFFTKEFIAFASSYFFIHYNLGNPRTPHLKEAFFANVIRPGRLTNLMKHENKTFQTS